MKRYDTQICVIAAGPSGLSAAVQSAQDGADVIVLEKAVQSEVRQIWGWGHWE